MHVRGVDGELAQVGLDADGVACVEAQDRAESAIVHGSLKETLAADGDRAPVLAEHREGLGDVGPVTVPGRDACGGAHLDVNRAPDDVRVEAQTEGAPPVPHVSEDVASRVWAEEVAFVGQALWLGLAEAVDDQRRSGSALDSRQPQRRETGGVDAGECPAWGAEDARELCAAGTGTGGQRGRRIAALDEDVEVALPGRDRAGHLAVDGDVSVLALRAGRIAAGDL